MQHPAAEDLQAQDSLFSGMRQIVINTSNGVSKTILAGMGISSFANIIPRNKGKCRSLGVFIITPPHNATMPTITSSAWDGNHFLVWITPKDISSGSPTTAGAISQTTTLSRCGRALSQDAPETD